MNRVSDIGFELLADNSDVAGTTEWRGGVAADFKIAIVPKETEMPFDLSVGAGLGYQWGADLSNYLIPVGGQLSRPVELSGGHVLVPYGGVYLLTSYASFAGEGDWEFDVELRGGAAYRITQTTSAFAALFLGAGTKFYAGVSFVL